MSTLISRRKLSVSLCGSNATSWADSGELNAGETSHESRLIITCSFKGLLDRVAKVDPFNLWYDWSRAKKVARKQKREPTIRMSEVQDMTGLTREDLELFTTAIPLIEVVELGVDPLLSFREVYCLTKIFQRMVDNEVIRHTTEA